MLLAYHGLQQYLPFTVLKQEAWKEASVSDELRKLQQYLPFTVLKLT